MKMVIEVLADASVAGLRARARAALKREFSPCFNGERRPVYMTADQERPLLSRRKLGPATDPTIFLFLAFLNPSRDNRIQPLTTRLAGLCNRR